MFDIDKLHAAILGATDARIAQAFMASKHDESKEGKKALEGVKAACIEAESELHDRLTELSGALSAASKAAANTGGYQRGGLR